MYVMVMVVLDGDDHDDASISRRGGLLCQELFLQTSDARPVFFWTLFTAAKLMCTAYNRDEDDFKITTQKISFQLSIKVLFL